METVINFVDTEKFFPVSTVNKIEKLRIISVGRINEQKNVLSFIDAINHVVQKGYNIIVNWYGRFEEEEYFEKCKLKIKEYKLVEHFVFFDPSNNIIDKYQQSDVFCLPSIYEGTPNVVIEAMACALPILCGDVCDNSRIIQNNENGYLFDPNSPNDIANKIIKFYNLSYIDKENMKLMSRSISMTKFSKDRFIQQYINLINR